MMSETLVNPELSQDWGLAPISQDFYRALHAVQATYGAYWSDHRVLDCKRRGEGLVEIPEERDIEMGARSAISTAISAKKRQWKPAKAENSMRQKAGKAAKEQNEDNDEKDPPEEDIGDDGLPVESQSKETEGDGDGSDNSAESSAGSGEEEEEDNDAVPSRKTGKATRTANNASSEASPSKKSKSSKTPSSSADRSWASEADGGKRAEADGSDEETQDEDTGVDTGRPSQMSDSDEESSAGSGEEEEEDNDAVPSRKTGKATRTANNASSEASPSKKSKSSKTPSSSADRSWASEADGGKRAEADGSDEDADVRDVDTGGNASHSKAEEAPARSPSEGIFKVKASQAAEPALDDGILPSNSRLSIGERAPTAASAVENNTLGKTPQGRRKATDVATNQGSENAYQGSSVEGEDLSLGDEEDLDLDWPEGDEKVKSRQDAKPLASTAKAKTGSRHGQDATIEIQEVSQSATGGPVWTEDSSAQAFEETEHRLREDIESLRKLEEELQLRGAKGTSQPKQTKAQKAGGSAASHKRRKGPAEAAVGQQAVSLLEIGSAPESEELQTLQIEQLAAGQREVAMKAAQEVADSSASPMTAEQLDRTRRAALQSVEHAVAEQVNAQERQTAKAAGAMSELFAGVQSDRKAITSKMVKRLQADLTETKEQAEKDHQ
ncbi:ACP5, partial [Symbiodinium sp. CCMP2456]